MSERSTAPDSDPIGPIYVGSNGQYYTDWQVGQRMASGAWKACIWDGSTERQLVGTGDERLLMLERADPDALPTWAEVRRDGERVRIVDTRARTSDE